MESVRPTSSKTTSSGEQVPFGDIAVTSKRLVYPSYFCPEAADPFEQVSWHTLDVVLKDNEGNTVFEQKNVEAPVRWSERAVRIVAQKYFRGRLGTPERESSVRQIVQRVVDTICLWVNDQEYFETADDIRRFYNDLVVLLLTQRGSFNSPVWFNLGVRGTLPQVSACFIQSVEDNMQAIAELQMGETLIFKRGSGTGTNFSSLRSKKEHLAGGGTASGPVSFMKGLDSWAGVIKSGGKTRRAAKMAILNIDHPDILEFIDCKLKEELRAQELAKAGYSMDFDDPEGAYASVAFQNANHSVRVTDAFMRLVQVAMENSEADPLWPLISRTTNEIIDTIPVRTLWNKICDAAHNCGDPGLQFDTVTNTWHTCPSDGRINATNPCCFIGETLIETSEGRIRIEDLATRAVQGGTLPFALSYDPATRMPVARQIKHAWKSGDARSLVRVTTVRGLSFLCTPEHRWYLRDGQSIQAIKLTPGTRLMKLNFWRNAARSNRRVVNHRCTAKAKHGTVWFNRWLWEQVHGPIPDNIEVHHLNDDPTDDRLSNYGLKSRTVHRQYHACGMANPRFLEVPAAQLVEIWEALEVQPKRTHKHSPLVTPMRWNHYVREHGLQGIIPLANVQRGIQGMSWATFTDFIEKQRSEVNDAIDTIELLNLDSTVPVYDLEVEGVHNFGIACAGFEHAPVVSNSEFAFLDDTSCNLASLNLMAFTNHATEIFDEEAFRKAVAVFIIAQDALVDPAFYPTERIATATKKYRALGLGYTNLGAFLMANGVPYDSPAARALTSEITSLMTSTAYLTSAKIAGTLGSFEAYERNRPAMLQVLKQHLDEAEKHHLRSAEVWKYAIAAGEVCGYRNAQVTLLAPTGTISFMLDCDTTGCEPEISLYKVKKLVGGGSVVLENRIVDQSLKTLGYSDHEREGMLRYLGENKTLEGCSWLRSQHLPVFDCAVPSAGKRSLLLSAHLDMMMAIQPFISGAISKTVNMAASATAEDIGKAFFNAWCNGIKNIIIYRNRSKLSQPIESKKAVAAIIPDPTPVRRKLRDHQNNCHRIKIEFGQMEGYLVATPYEDTGMPGEIFVVLSKEGSTISGLVDGWATSVSLCLQYGVPLEKLVDKFSHAKFEPAGFSSDPDIRHASSIYDAIIRKLAAVFLTPTPAASLDAVKVGEIKTDKPFAVVDGVMERPICTTCGSIMQQNGATCYVCPVCGTGGGCS